MTVSTSSSGECFRWNPWAVRCLDNEGRAEVRNKQLLSLRSSRSELEKRICIEVVPGTTRSERRPGVLRDEMLKRTGSPQVELELGGKLELRDGL